MGRQNKFCRALAAGVCLAWLAGAAWADTISLGPYEEQLYYFAPGTEEDSGIRITNLTDVPDTITVERGQADLAPPAPGFVLLDNTFVEVAPASLGPRDMLLRVRMEYRPARARAMGLRPRNLRLMRLRARDQQWHPIDRVMRARGLCPRRILGRPMYRVGNYGVCLDDTYVWAVIDLPGTYAIGAPEPASLACVLGGAGLLWLRRRRGRTLS